MIHLSTYSRYHTTHETASAQHTRTATREGAGHRTRAQTGPRACTRPDHLALAHETIPEAKGADGGPERSSSGQRAQGKDLYAMLALSSGKALGTLHDLPKLASELADKCNSKRAC